LFLRLCRPFYGIHRVEGFDVAVGYSALEDKTFLTNLNFLPVTCRLHLMSGTKPLHIVDTGMEECYVDNMKEAAERLQKVFWS
jgi:hypothetical protein